jgi:DNA-binding transcriptional regulator YiaG
MDKTAQKAQFDAFRAELGLTPTQAAKALGVPYDTFKDWQSGRRTPPSVAFRCIELLLLYPKTAKRLSK